MGALIGLCLALGVLLVIVAFAEPSARLRKRSRLQALVDSAALPHATPGSVLSVAVAGALICGAGALVITSVPVVALIAAAVMALLPFMLLRRRARARTRSV